MVERLLKDEGWSLKAERRRRSIDHRPLTTDH
jgi:hypothetical protein